QRKASVISKRIAHPWWQSLQAPCTLRAPRQTPAVIASEAKQSRNAGRAPHESPDNARRVTSPQTAHAALRVLKQRTARYESPDNARRVTRLLRRASRSSQ